MQTSAATIASAQTRIAASGGHHIGDLISWNSGGVDVLRETARDVFKAEGFESSVPGMEPGTALYRAQAELRRAEGIVVKPFAKPNKDTPAAFGVYVRKPCDGEGGDDFEPGARVRVDPQTKQIVALPPEGREAIPEAMAHAEMIASKANHLLTHVAMIDVGKAMVTVVRILGGVPLRDRGGFYLLPPSTCDVWRRLTPGLKQIGVRPIRIEMHDAPENVATASDAAKTALEEEIKVLLEDLDRADSEGMRSDALDRRVTECRELGAKADLFAAVLQDKVGEIKGKLDKMRARFEKLLKGGEGGADPDADLFTLDLN